jgi:hypothetical protein
MGQEEMDALIHSKLRRFVVGKLAKPLRSGDVP